MEGRGKMNEGKGEKRGEERVKCGKKGRLGGRKEWVVE